MRLGIVDGRYRADGTRFESITNYEERMTNDPDSGRAYFDESPRRYSRPRTNGGYLGEKSVLPTRDTYAEIFVDRMETELRQRPDEGVVQCLRCGQCFGKDVHGRVVRRVLVDEPT